MNASIPVQRSRVDVDFGVVRVDDELLDTLGAALLPVAVDLADDVLAALLLAWRLDVDVEPVSASRCPRRTSCLFPLTVVCLRDTIAWSLPVNIKLEFANPAEEADSIALAIARQQMAHEVSPVPTWDELNGAEQWGATLDARNYLRALDRAGLRQVVTDFAQAAAAEMSEELARLGLELQHAYADADRVEHQHGLDQVALRQALRIQPGERYSMTQLVRRVRQVVAELDDARRRATTVRTGLHEISATLREQIAGNDGVAKLENAISTVGGDLRG